MTEVDDHFFNRADEYIGLANQHLAEVSQGKVSASLMYSVARFNAWVSACGWNSAREMADAKTETIEYYVEEYRKMLVENIEDYINNFDTYMKTLDSADSSTNV